MFHRSLLFLVVYCGSSVSLAALPTEPVSINAKSEIIQGKVAISGSTNFPDGTLLDVDVSNTLRGFQASETVSVKEGRFNTVPLGPDSGMLPGSYQVEISARITDKQPKSVLAVVGKNGELLKGSLVRKIAGWRGDYFAVEYITILRVGTQADGKRVDQQFRKEIELLLNDLAVLYESGVRIHRMYDINDLDQLKACVAANSSLRDKAKLLRQKASNLSRMDYRTKLTMASDDAFTCVYCGGTGKDCMNIPIALEAVRKSLATENNR